MFKENFSETNNATPEIINSEVTVDELKDQIQEMETGIDSMMKERLKEEARVKIMESEEDAYIENPHKYNSDIKKPIVKTFEKKISDLTDKIMSVFSANQKRREEAVKKFEEKNIEVEEAA